MKISNAVSSAIDDVSTKVITPSEAKRKIALALYQSIVDYRTIGDLTQHDQMMVCDVSELLGIDMKFYGNKIVGQIRKEDVNGTV